MTVATPTQPKRRSNNPAFIPGGPSPNPRGRGKGVLSKINRGIADDAQAARDARELVRAVACGDAERLRHLGVDPRSVSLDDRLKAFTALAPYEFRRMPQALDVQVIEQEASAKFIGLLQLATEAELEILLPLLERSHALGKQRRPLPLVIESEDTNG